MIYNPNNVDLRYTCCITMSSSLRHCLYLTSDVDDVDDNDVDVDTYLRSHDYDNLPSHHGIG